MPLFFTCGFSRKRLLHNAGWFDCFFFCLSYRTELEKLRAENAKLQEQLEIYEINKEQMHMQVWLNNLEIIIMPWKLMNSQLSLVKKNNNKKKKKTGVGNDGKEASFILPSILCANSIFWQEMTGDESNFVLVLWSTWKNCDNLGLKLKFARKLYFW